MSNNSKKFQMNCTLYRTQQTTSKDNMIYFKPTRETLHTVYAVREIIEKDARKNCGGT